MNVCVNFVNCVFTAPGHVAEHVIIERDDDTTVTFTDTGNQITNEAYLGYVTIKVL